jgi:glycosyltransferase involved in cell wall biosynthesis
MSDLVLVHDYLLVMRGGERTFATMADIWPDAPIATLLYDEAGTHRRFAGRRVRTSPLQRLQLRQRTFRMGLPLYPSAIHRLPVEDARCIVSSSSAFAHGVRKPPRSRHVCYCHSPFRYAWHEQAMAMGEVPATARPALRLMLRRHRAFDRRAARAVDQFVANSEVTRERIRRYWGRDAVVVNPPVDVDRFTVREADDYVLFVGELVRHKRPELAIQAAIDAGRRIKVVGGGPELKRLQERYGHTAEFVGRVEDEQLARLYAEAAALVVPSVEEFGVAAVEAQASGRPVVAIDAGGARETVVNGRTGLLVPNGDSSALTAALRQDLNTFDPLEIRTNAQRFTPGAFASRLREIVEAPGRAISKPRAPRRSPIRS